MKFILAAGAILCWKCLVLLLPVESSGSWVRLPIVHRALAPSPAPHPQEEAGLPPSWESGCTLGWLFCMQNSQLYLLLFSQCWAMALWPCSCSTIKSHPQPNHSEAKIFLQNSCPLFVLRYLFLLVLCYFGGLVLFLSIHSGVCLLLSFPKGILFCNNNKVGQGSRVVIKTKLLGITLIKS